MRKQLTRKKWLGLLLVITTAMFLVSCASQPEPPGADLPGFFWGLAHGFIILFSFIASIFTDARIYAYPNSGFLYDLGFLLGAMMFLGGGGAGSRSKKKKRD